MSTFTKGPWKVDGALDTAVTDAKDNIIALCGESVLLDLAEKRSNARLISATPDMYEALKAFVRYHDSDHDDDVVMMLDYADAVEAAKAALSKADGREG